ncbi:hypothetical protein ACTFIW_003308 [Dictyostelium discoideum]
MVRLSPRVTEERRVQSNPTSVRSNPDGYLRISREPSNFQLLNNQNECTPPRLESMEAMSGLPTTHSFAFYPGEDELIQFEESLPPLPSFSDESHMTVITLFVDFTTSKRFDHHRLEYKSLFSSVGTGALHYTKRTWIFVERSCQEKIHKPKDIKCYSDYSKNSGRPIKGFQANSKEQYRLRDIENEDFLNFFAVHLSIEWKHNQWIFQRLTLDLTEINNSFIQSVDTLVFDETVFARIHSTYVPVYEGKRKPFEVQVLQLDDAIEQVHPNCYSKRVFYSNVFTVPKPGTTLHRPVLDLKRLNTYINKMEGIKNLPSMVKQGYYMVKLDIKKAYLHGDWDVKPETSHWLTVLNQWNGKEISLFPSYDYVLTTDASESGAGAIPKKGNKIIKTWSFQWSTTQSNMILQCKSRPPQPSFRDESQIVIQSNQELQLSTEKRIVQWYPTSFRSNPDGSVRISPEPSNDQWYPTSIRSNTNGSVRISPEPSNEQLETGDYSTFQSHVMSIIRIQKPITAELLMKFWEPSTLKVYSSSYTRFRNFCTSNYLNPTNITLVSVCKSSIQVLIYYQSYPQVHIHCASKENTLKELILVNGAENRAFNTKTEGATPKVTASDIESNRPPKSLCAFYVILHKRVREQGGAYGAGSSLPAMQAAIGFVACFLIHEEANASSQPSISPTKRTPLFEDSVQKAEEYR